jgi:hypothetical protein
MTQRTKNIALLLLSAALISVILLAASLSNLQLHPGSPFPGGGNSGDSANPAAASPSLKSYSFPILQGILALIFLILVIYVPIRMMALVNVKVILRLVLAMVILLVLIFLLPHLDLGQPAYIPSEPSGISTPPSFDYPVTPLGRPPQALIWLVIIGIGLGLSVFIFTLVKGWLRPPPVEAELLQDAEAAVNDLKAGADLKNVIIRCYLQMTRSLQEERGIERNYAMTVREFETRLNSLGFPAAPVHQLTSLFEKLRYGEQAMDANDEQVAVESLSQIIQFCRNGRDETDAQA